MKKFKVHVHECVTLVRKQTHVIEARSADEARQVGEIRYGKANHFVGAEPA